jgi:hypothetical protein
MREEWAAHSNVESATAALFTSGDCAQSLVPHSSSSEPQLLKSSLKIRCHFLARDACFVLRLSWDPAKNTRGGWAPSTKITSVTVALLSSEDLAQSLVLYMQLRDATAEDVTGTGCTHAGEDTVMNVLVANIFLAKADLLPIGDFARSLDLYLQHQGAADKDRDCSGSLASPMIRSWTSLWPT